MTLSHKTYRKYIKSRSTVSNTTRLHAS